MFSLRARHRAPAFLSCINGQPNARAVFIEDAAAGCLPPSSCTTGHTPAVFAGAYGPAERSLKQPSFYALSGGTPALRPKGPIGPKGLGLRSARPPKSQAPANADPMHAAPGFSRPPASRGLDCSVRPQAAGLLRGRTQLTPQSSAGDQVPGLASKRLLQSRLAQKPTCRLSDVEPSSRVVIQAGPQIKKHS